MIFGPVSKTEPARQVKRGVYERRVVRKSTAGELLPKPTCLVCWRSSYVPGASLTVGEEPIKARLANHSYNSLHLLLANRDGRHSP